MRITNIDTFSAYCDRLITERIKWFFFNKDGKLELAAHQVKVIEEIKLKMNDVLLEILKEGGYEYLSENRTFNENAIVEELEQLIVNDILIGEGDRARLEEITSNNPNFQIIIQNEKITRKSNEGRAKNKNKIDTLLHEIFRRPIQ